MFLITSGRQNLAPISQTSATVKGKVKGVDFSITFGGGDEDTDDQETTPTIEKTTQYATEDFFEKYGLYLGIGALVLFTGIKKV